MISIAYGSRQKHNSGLIQCVVVKLCFSLFYHVYAKEAFRTRIENSAQRSLEHMKLTDLTTLEWSSESVCA